MASMSCFDGMYRAWGRIIANQGVAVAMVDFRNCVTAVVGARGRAVPGRAERLRVRPEVGRRARRTSSASTPTHIIVAGESGGGNLTLATGLKLKARRRPRTDPRPLRAVPVHRRAAGRRTGSRRRSRTTASCSTCTTTAARWATASRSSRRATRWRGRRSPPRTTSRGLVPDGHQRERVRSAARRGHRVLPAAAAGRRAAPAAAR